MREMLAPLVAVAMVIVGLALAHLNAGRVDRYYQRRYSRQAMRRNRRRH